MSNNVRANELRGEKRNRLCFRTVRYKDVAQTPDGLNVTGCAGSSSTMRRRREICTSMGVPLRNIHDHGQGSSAYRGRRLTRMADQCLQYRKLTTGERIGSSSRNISRVPRLSLNLPKQLPPLPVTVRLAVRSPDDAHRTNAGQQFTRVKRFWNVIVAPISRPTIRSTSSPFAVTIRSASGYSGYEDVGKSTSHLHR